MSNGINGLGGLERIVLKYLTNDSTRASIKNHRGKLMDNFIPLYDLESLTEHQRQEYVRGVCKHMGVPDNLNLIALTYVDDGDGPARLVPYAKRGATENVRNSLQIDIESLDHKMVNGSIVFTVTARSKVTGRREISTGSKWIDNLQGTALDDAIMTAQTRALRRVTLQFIGAGVLDESEVTQRKTVHVTSTPVVTPQPTVQPSNEPGKDITGELERTATAEIPRAEVIAKLNEEAKPEPKKTRKPRKAKVDFGPSEPTVVPLVGQAAPIDQPVIKYVPVVEEAIPATEPVAIPAPAPVVEQPKAAVEAAPVPSVSEKQKLTREQLKPYQQRLYHLLTDYLEPAGFEPKPDMGNPAKLRALAQIMFSDITNMNELSAEQWEKYLSPLEAKVKVDPKGAVKHIEDLIGV